MPYWITGDGLNKFSLHQV